jgi:hypothetical protein
VVYGTQVDDFKQVDKQMIGIMSLAGVQELVSRYQQQEIRRERLRSALESARSILSLLETTM